MLYKRAYERTSIYSNAKNGVGKELLLQRKIDNQNNPITEQWTVVPSGAGRSRQCHTESTTAKFVLITLFFPEVDL